MNLVIEEEGRHLARERFQQRPERRANRWGKEDGYCVVDMGYGDMGHAATQEALIAKTQGSRDPARPIGPAAKSKLV